MQNKVEFVTIDVEDDGTVTISAVDGTNESTMRSVSESMKTSFTNCSGPTQRR